MEYSKNDLIKVDEIACLGTRVKNALCKLNIVTLGEMVEFFSINNVEDVKNLGSKSKQEINEVLGKYNFGEHIETMSEKSFSNASNIIEVYPFENMNECNELMKTEVLGLFGISKPVRNAFIKKGINKVGDLKVKSINDMLCLIKTLDIEKILWVAKVFEKNYVDIFNDFIICNNDKSEYQCFFRRATGETLQEIADNPPCNKEGKLTRERVRQLQEKFFSITKDFIDVLLEKCLIEKRYITLSLLEDKFKNNDALLVLQYFLKKHSEYEYLDFAEVFVRREENSLEKRLLNITSEFIGIDGLDLSENLENFEQLMVSNNLEFIDIYSYINFLNKNGYIFYRDFVTKGRVSYAVLCVKVVSKYYDGSIKTTQDDTEKSEDLDKLRRLVFKEYGELDMPESNRALCSRMSSYMVLSGRGKLIPKDKINIDEDVLLDIKKWIDNFPNHKIFYSEIFGEFEAVLKATSNIDNYNFLHGVICLYFGDCYNVSSRDYLIKNGENVGEYISLTDRIETFVLSKGRPVHRKEIKEQFPGISDVVLFNRVPTCERLIQWEYNYYSSMKLLKINDEDKEKLNNILNKIMNLNDGYSSIGLLYSKVNLEFKEFLIINNIKSEINLYYVIENIFREKYDFRRPHITKKNKFENLHLKDVALSFMGSCEKISYEKYMDLSQNMMWSPVTTGMVFADIEEDYIRINKDEYIKKQLFEVSQHQLSTISNCIRSNFCNDMFPLKLLNDFENYPDLKYPWNEFLLGSLCQKYLKEYKIIYPISKDRRRQNGVIVAIDSNLKTYSDLVCKLMKCTNDFVLSEKQMLAFLLKHGLTNQTVPKELRSCNLIKYNNEIYELV